MKYLNHNIAAMALALALCLGTASCSSTDKEAALPGKQTTAVAVEPGKAGGIVVDTYTVSATVSAINASSRKITLKADDGTKTTFKAPPEMRNFDQVHVSDRVSVTLARQLVVFVRSDGAPASASYTEGVALAPKGAKPGGIMADVVEIVATVQSINLASRTATLRFADGETRTVAARPDVDLTKYKAGDSVVIRVTELAAVSVEKT